MSIWNQGLTATAGESEDVNTYHTLDVTSAEYIISMMKGITGRLFWDANNLIVDKFLATLYEPEVLEYVIQYAEEYHFDNRVLALLYSHPNISQKILVQGANNTRWWVRAAVAMHPLLRVELQEKLATNTVSDVREKVAENPNLDANVYAILAEDNFFGTIYRLWQNTYHQTVELELKLSSFFIPNDPSDRNPVPSFTKNPETLYILCSHEDKRVREDAAKNPHCPEDGIIIARLLG